MHGYSRSKAASIAAFAGLLLLLGRLQAGDRALADLLVSTTFRVPELETLRARAFDGLVAGKFGKCHDAKH